MNRNVFAGLLALGMLGWTVALAWSRPPGDDVSRRAKVREMYDAYAAAFPEVPSIAVEEALPHLGDPAWVWVDVREPGERAVSMVPGAIPREAFDADPTAYAGRTVVTYCTIGYRSGMYARDLAARGVDVRNLAGSLLAWTHAGGPLVRDGQPTRDVHVYGARWNLAASGYRGVW